MKLADEWKQLRKLARAAVEDALHVSATTALRRAGDPGQPAILRTDIHLTGDVSTVFPGDRLTAPLLALHEAAVGTALQIHRDRIEAALRLLSAAV